MGRAPPAGMVRGSSTTSSQSRPWMKSAPGSSSSAHGHWMPPSGLEPGVAHPCMDRRERAQLVPDVLGRRASRARNRGADRARRRSRCRRGRTAGASYALRTRCTRRSLEVTVPSTSPSVAAAGRTTSASSSRAREEEVLDDEMVEPLEQALGPLLVRLSPAPGSRRRRRRPSARRAPSPRTSRSGEARSRGSISAPHADSNFVRAASSREVLEAGQPVRERAHVSPTLDVVLAAQRLETRSPTCRPCRSAARG